MSGAQSGHESVQVCEEGHNVHVINAEEQKDVDVQPDTGAGTGTHNMKEQYIMTDCEATTSSSLVESERLHCANQSKQALSYTPYST